MVLWLTLGTVACVAIPVVLLRGRLTGARTVPPATRELAAGSRQDTRTPTSRHPFHSVSVVPGRNACAAVLATRGHRFLPSSAPRLPVAGCDRSTCRCVYTHHDDRRHREDRRLGLGSVLRRDARTDRRSVAGRRRADSLPD